MVGKISLVVASAVFAWVYWHVIPAVRSHRGVRKMEADVEGNYDIDGVSYDPLAHQVVVTGDGRTREPSTEVLVVAEVVKLHAPTGEAAEKRGA